MALKFTVVIELHSANGCPLQEVNDLPIVTFVNCEHPLKAHSGRCSTLSPIFKTVSDEQFLKTGESQVPIVVQFMALKFTDAILKQLEKAPLPMVETEDGMVMDVRYMQLEKAQASMVETELGIMMELIPVQPEKAWSPMLIMEFGIVTAVSSVQP